YKQLQRRVERMERLVEGRGLQTQTHWAELKKQWREGWTPARIIAAGLVSGFVSGRAEPLRALSGPRLLQMIGAVSGLFASVQATVAAGQAEKAADTAEEATADVADSTANTADARSEQTVPASRMSETRDAGFSTQPRPAEAATELSER
ncbi:MAG: protein sip-5, partial [Pseudoxanthomonas sp.]